jgi:hypothetical protein
VELFLFLALATHPGRFGQRIDLFNLAFPLCDAETPTFFITNHLYRHHRLPIRPMRQYPSDWGSFEVRPVTKTALEAAPKPIFSAL